MIKISLPQTKKAMPREVVTIQCGQCGNQVGADFWRRLCVEHGINTNGDLVPEAVDMDDRKDVFFDQNDANHFVPRAILLDLEPKVIASIRTTSPVRSLFNSENIYVPPENAGAGNNWASGYQQAKRYMEHILEMIDREAEGADSLCGFNLTHAIAGGTGSGLGSMLLEVLSDRYPKKLLQTYSIFPNPTASDIVTQPYNSMLTLRRLSEFADSTIVIDNSALDRITEKFEKVRSIQEANSVISQVMCASTATLRLPGFMVNDLHSLVGSLVPVPKLHFLISAYTPINEQLTQDGMEAEYDANRAVREIYEHNAQTRKTSVLDVMRRLLQPANGLVSCSRDGGYIALLNMINGEVDSQQIYKSVARLKERRSVKFCPWTQQNVQMAVTQQSQLVARRSKVSGLLLANHTSIREVFAAMNAQFLKMFREGHNAANIHGFAEQFGGQQEALDEFNAARESCESLIREYQDAESAQYLDL